MSNHYSKCFTKSKDTDERETPDVIFDYWNNLFNFNLDVAASKEKLIATNNFCSTIPWPKRIKFNGSKNNSPFGSTFIILWGLIK